MAEGPSSLEAFDSHENGEAPAAQVDTYQSAVRCSRCPSSLRRAINQPFNALVRCRATAGKLRDRRLTPSPSQPPRT